MYYFSHKSAEIFIITSDIKHVVTNMELFWQPIKYSIKKALYNIAFVTFVKEFRCLPNITPYFTFSLQSILQHVFESY